jgi:hypothetical protein
MDKRNKKRAKKNDEVQTNTQNYTENRQQEEAGYSTKSYTIGSPKFDEYYKVSLRHSNFN